MTALATPALGFAPAMGWGDSRRRAARAGDEKPMTGEARSLVELVQAAQQGDESAFRPLILAYQRRLAAFVYTVIGRSEAIEDLVQLVFIKMARGIGKLRQPEQFESWLFQSARNTCIDHLRQRRRQAIFTPIADQHLDVTDPVRPVDCEELDALLCALSRLSARDRVLVGLAREERTLREMAQVTGTTVMVLKARLHRARSRLRRYYVARR
jgi:RNA polymerase sigma-70 factor (ECF subfamily)